ncbi:hypothetical protein [Desulfonatronovibrio magnus]|uniref:VgrG-related protein n=1 Tax=Desulfonatronovibrio magnus TaxID=698827 RepID=UPI000698386B|nr:hypothetical protein [Desulfonatronovibrio magnus]
MNSRINKICTAVLTACLAAYPLPILSAVPINSFPHEMKADLILENDFFKANTKELTGTPINHPEQHMAALQQKLMGNSQSSSEEAHNKTLELIMNNSLSTALPSTAPVASSSIPQSVLLSRIKTQNTDSEKTVGKDPGVMDETTSGSRIRMAISADTPRFPVNKVRQKIDFQARINQPDLQNMNISEQDDPAINFFSNLDDLINHRRISSGFNSLSLQSTFIEKLISPAQDNVVPHLLRQETLNEILARVPPFREHEPDRKGKVNVLSDYMEHAAYRAQNPAQPAQSVQTEAVRPGQLAARFESVNSSAAIGFDRKGGTCYGIYQLSSKMGTMGEFIEFLHDKAPDLSKRLRQSGPANTNGRSGKMPAEWKKINEEYPERITDLQHEFIYSKFYLPAARGVRARTGLDMEQASPALREVLWSTAVQHGVHGAMNIFQRAATAVNFQPSDRQDREMIMAVYNERSRRFTGSSEIVRTAVLIRFSMEVKKALAMLNDSTDT